MKLGSKDISKVYLGSKEIDKIYLGSNEIFTAEVSPNGSPSSLTVTVLSYTSIKLDWTIGSTNHDGHRIYYKPEGGNYSVLDTVTGSTATYTATGLTPEISYYFYVVAFKGSKESSPSNVVTAYINDFKDETILDLRPSSTTGKDTTIYTLNPTYNRGAFAYISSGELTGVVNILRGLIQFDLSSIPDNAIITEAFLYLHLNIDYSNNARNVKIYRMKREWVQGTGNDAASGDGATWNTYDGVHNWTSAGGFNSSDCEQVEIGSHLMSDSESVKKCEIFKLTPTSKSGLDLGYGWMIKTDTESDDGYRYYSSNSTTVWLRPALYISYILPNQTSYKVLRDASNPFFEGRFGCVIYNSTNNNYEYYYSNGTDIYKATSIDGKTNWSTGTLVLSPNTGVIDLCYITVEDGIIDMFYRSTEWGYWAIGLATSIDNGVSFTKYGLNPIISPQEAWEGSEIDVWGIKKISDNLYGGWLNNVNISPRQMVYITSTDKINWTRYQSTPMFTGYYCPESFTYKGYHYLIAPKSDILANQDSNPLTKKFALFRDSDPRFLPSSRQYLGYIMNGGGLGAWDGMYLETPCVLTDNIYKDSFPNDELRIYYTGIGWYPTSMWTGLANGNFTTIEKLRAITEP